MDLPVFKYHPNPIGTKSVEPSSATCQCCGKARGFIYTGNVYCKQDVEHVCPWCIAEGAVATKFKATLSDSCSLMEAEVPGDIVDEVTERTPGYVSWQQDSWMACCKDACEFHGDAPLDELRNLSEEALSALADEAELEADELEELFEAYTPGESPAFYKFVCRHCQRAHYNADCD